MRSRRSLLLGAACVLLAAGAITAAAALPRKGPSVPAPPLQLPVPETSSIELTDQTWVCDGPVDLDSVTVTITSAANRRDRDGVHLRDGCTGRIGRLAVTQYVADGVKISDGVHDLVIGGGTIRCIAKAPILHQDGIQVMGGARITLRNMTVDCGRTDSRLVNSNLFINESGRATTPPTDVVCIDCDFGGAAAHTVNIQTSVRSGVVSSSLCEAKWPRLTLTIGPDAVDPVDVRNTISGC